MWKCNNFYYCHNIIELVCRMYEEKYMCANYFYDHEPFIIVTKLKSVSTYTVSIMYVSRELYIIYLHKFPP